MCSNIGLVKETNCCLCSFAIYCLLRTNFVNLVKQADRDVRVQTFVLIFSSFSKLALYECTGVFQIVFRPFFLYICGDSYPRAIHYNVNMILDLLIRFHWVVC